MSSTFVVPITGGMNDFMLRRVEKKLNTIPETEKPLLKYQIRSYGGNLKTLHELCDLSYKWRSEIEGRGCQAIAQGWWIESAALAFFLSFDIRQVHETATGIIHLPEISEGKEASLEKHQEVRSEFIEYIRRRTGLSPEVIQKFEHQRLTASQMFNLGIATEIVDDFSLPIKTVVSTAPSKAA